MGKAAEAASTGHFTLCSEKLELTFAPSANILVVLARRSGVFVVALRLPRSLVSVSVLTLSFEWTLLKRSESIRPPLSVAVAVAPS